MPGQALVQINVGFGGETKGNCVGKELRKGSRLLDGPMRISSKRISAIIIATVIGCGLLSSRVIAQTVGPSDPLWTAQNLLRAFYPELAARKLQMLVFQDGSFDDDWLTAQFLRNFGVEVQEHISDFLKREGPDPMLLLASCSFDAAGRVNEVAIQGRIAHQRENEEMRRDINAHREWTDAQVQDALAARGAKFGPTEQKRLLNTLPMAVLEGLLGGKVRLGAAVFETRAHPDDPIYSDALMTWTIDLQVQTTTQRAPLNYSLIVEPIGGKLRHIIRAVP